MHLLQTWLLSEKNYSVGVSLLQSFGGSNTWISLFEKLGETTYTRVELHKQIDALLTLIETKFIPEEVEVITPKKRPHEEESAPDVIKNIKEKRIQNFKFANQIHYSLVLHVEAMLTENKPIVDDTKAKIFELRKLLEEMDHAWNACDNYDATRALPVQTEKVTSKKIVNINHASDRRRTLKLYLMPSYLKRIPEERREQFIQDTRKELDELNLLIAENESIIQL